MHTAVDPQAILGIEYAHGTATFEITWAMRKVREQSETLGPFVRIIRGGPLLREHSWRINREDIREGTIVKNISEGTIVKEQS